MKAVNNNEHVVNPVDESQLDDQRNQIAENCFVELDIAMKAYTICLGEDLGYEMMSLLHSTFAYVLGTHRNEHKLANIDIEKFEIPDSTFKTKDGEPTDKLYHLQDVDILHYITNLIMNAKQGTEELKNSGYFEGFKENELIINKQGLLFQLSFQFDSMILMMNNKYSRQVTFNFNK